MNTLVWTVQQLTLSRLTLSFFCRQSSYPNLKVNSPHNPTQPLPPIINSAITNEKSSQNEPDQVSDKQMRRLFK